MDCGALRLMDFKSDDERDRFLDETRKRMGLSEPRPEHIIPFAEEVRVVCAIRERVKQGSFLMPTAEQLM